MSLLTLIDGIPLYSTTQEAIAWGDTFGLSTFHTHVFEGQVGYMSGATHEDIDLAFNEIGLTVSEGEDEQSNVTIPVITTETQAPVVIPTTTTTTTTTTTSGGSSGGY